jgi:two-component system cell cycle sensor histidine kinase/response regulator CckA
MGHVLYLDDEQALVFLVSRALTDLGHSVLGFTSAPEALEAFREHPQDFDLVLTDMSMYGMSGLEFAQQILQIEPRAMVVIATGCEDPNWADHARASGVRAVIEKPTTIDAMARAIVGLLVGRSGRDR